MISMDSCILLLFLFICILNPCIKSWDLSKEEDMELERQLKLLNKPAIKTIKSYHGAVYDCVDFYKQPAFDHPQTNNFTIEKSTLLRMQRRAKSSSNSNLGIELPGGGCPLGTVPIRRTTKKDLIRKKLASKARTLDTSNVPGADYAIVRTQFKDKMYGGMTGSISTWNPPCVGNQYSAARLKFLNGPDSLEVGWKVDPLYYGDNMTHIYIRTDAGQSHCYDLDCPGFIASDPSSPIGGSLTKISKRGGKKYQIRFRIIRDASRNWVLQAGPSYDPVGMWPATMFTKAGGLGDMATTLEWGGEVFSPEGTPKPQMGAGLLPVHDTNLDAFVSEIKVSRNQGSFEEIYNLERYIDGFENNVLDEGVTKTSFGHLITYGGRGT